MIQTVNHPTTGLPHKFGARIRPPKGARPKFCAKFGDHVKLVDAPASADYTQAALASLHNIMCNDRLGCCVVAAGYHLLGTLTGNAGALFNATDAQIIADYGMIGGYNPSDPSTDQGCDEVTAIDEWTQNGFANNSKVVGAIEVDGTNAAEVRSSIYLFEGALLCEELPDAYVNPMPGGDGFLWGVAGDPNPNSGHATMLAGYDADDAAKVVTWGMIGKKSFEAIAKYNVESAGGSLYIVLTHDILARGVCKAPNGMEWGDLVADLRSLGASVPDSAVAQ